MQAKHITPLALPFGSAAQIWKVQIAFAAESVNQSLALLTAEEQVRAARFYQQADRARFVISRAALRLLLADVLQTPPIEIAITYNEFGKPQLAGNSAVQFSVAHSGNLALIALADGAGVGVDIEQWREEIDVDAVLDQIASSYECSIFSTLPQAKRQQYLFQLWTLKEALLKAHGVGFQHDPRQCDVTSALTLHSGVHSITAADGSLWQMSTLAAPTTYSAAWAIYLQQFEHHLFNAVSEVERLTCDAPASLQVPPQNAEGASHIRRNF